MKNLKILISLIIIIALTLFCAAALFSCGKESEINIDLQDLANIIGEKIDLSNYEPYSLDKIRDDFGITQDDTVQIVALKDVDVLSAEMLIFIEAKDKETVEKIETKIKTFKTYKLNELKDYTLNPDNERQYYIVEDAEIIIEQNYVFWAAQNQSKEINDIIKDYIKNSKTK